MHHPRHVDVYNNKRCIKMHPIVPRMLCREVVRIHRGPPARGNHEAKTRVSPA